MTLRSVSDSDPHGQLWATAVADILSANSAAQHARREDRNRLDDDTLATLTNHYLSALAKGTADNLGHQDDLAQAVEDDVALDEDMTERLPPFACFGCRVRASRGMT